MYDSPVYLLCISCDIPGDAVQMRRVCAICRQNNKIHYDHSYTQKQTPQRTENKPIES